VGKEFSSGAPRPGIRLRSRGRLRIILFESAVFLRDLIGAGRYD
jgi:hypothetical protein